MRRIAKESTGGQSSRVGEAHARTANVSHLARAFDLGDTMKSISGGKSAVTACCDTGQFLGRAGQHVAGLIAADLARELANLEPVHLELERAEGNSQRPRGCRDVPARFLERADKEVALEGRHRPLEQVLRRGPLTVQLSYVQLVREVFV